MLDKEWSVTLRGNPGLASKVDEGDVLKLGASYYKVGKERDVIRRKLYNCDRNGKLLQGDVGYVELTSYNFEMFTRNKEDFLKEAVDF